MKPCVIAVHVASGETIRFSPLNIHNLLDAKAWVKRYVTDLVGKFEIVTPIWIQINGYQYDLD